jgi:two-component SAPR family response regulator
VQREGRLRLATDKVWVELANWESRLKQVLGANSLAGPATEFEALFMAFHGPPFFDDRPKAWAFAVAERVHGEFMDLACRVAAEREHEGDADGARAIYLRGLDFYPDSARFYEGLIQGRLTQNDVAGAVADHSRYERIVAAVGGEPSPALRNLVQSSLRHMGNLAP